MVIWMVMEIYASPFINRLSNSSGTFDEIDLTDPETIPPDWCSRIAYVVIAILGLAAALQLPGKSAYSGWLLVLVTVLCYSANGYFAVIGSGYMQRLIKRWQKRLDFSIDVFSPHLDLAKHIARRIQQETFSTLLLAEPALRISSKRPLCFNSVQTGIYTYNEKEPPYLLGFQGTQGERHVENLKVRVSIFT